MKKLLFYLVSMFFLFVGISGLNAETIKGNGKIVTKEFEVRDFDEITLAVPAIVNFTQSEQYSCSVTVDENLVQYIGVKTVGDDLNIRQLPSKNGKPLLSFSFGEKEVNLPKYKYVDLEYTTFVINISAPRLEDVKVLGSGTFNLVADFADAKLNVDVAGSGSFYADKMVKVNELDVELAGSGSVRITRITTSNAEISVAGSGKVQLNGSYAELDIRVNGSGEVEAYGKATSAKTKIAGSGNIYLGKVSKSIKYEIAGSGNVYYSGTAELLGVAAGSGRIQYKELSLDIPIDFEY